MKFFSIPLVLALFTVSACGHHQNRTYQPVVDLSGVDKELTVEPTTVMVLGTMHLSGLDDFDPDLLTPLLDGLAKFRPDVITIEAMPGEICEMIRLFPNEYPRVADSYCNDMSPYRAESGFSAVQGGVIVRERLTTMSDAPEPEARRELVAASLAEGDLYSALVQWLQIPEIERVPQNGIGPVSMGFLEKIANSANENTQIGARLAARLGLQRVFPIDDHSSDRIIAGYGDPFWERMSEIWPSRGSEAYSGWISASEQLANGDVLGAYRFFNSPETQEKALNNDFRRAMNDDEIPGYGRRYNSWYQVRNLRMVSSIVGASATEPGGRVLAIVGSSHKPYFEAYLNQMHDIEIVSTDIVLEEP